MRDTLLRIAPTYRPNHDDGAQITAQIVKAVYTDVPEAMHQLAELSVLAALEKLETEGRVARDGDRFALSSAA